jgi:hypothetical protein
MKIRSNFNIVINQMVILTIIEEMQKLPASQNFGEKLAFKLFTETINELTVFNHTFDSNGILADFTATKNEMGDIEVDFVFTCDAKDFEILNWINENKASILEAIMNKTANKEN